MRARIATLQGYFYVASGVWPLVHYRSFVRVTGEKTDRWLVVTVAGLLVVIGAAIALDPKRSRVLAVGTAGVLAAIDTIYVARRRISPIYLADAVIELGFAAAQVTQPAR